MTREIVDGARLAMKDNRRPAKVGDRTFELAKGILRCEHCGRAMIGYSRKNKGGSERRPYYRCDSPARGGGPCPNRKSHHADNVENRAREIVYEPFEEQAIEDLWAGYRKRQRELQRSGGSENRTALTETLEKLENKKHGYWELAADGDMPREIMRSKVADLDEQEQKIRAELARTREIEEQLADLEASFFELIELIEDDPESNSNLYDLSGTPEERRRRYAKMGVGFTVDSEGTLRAEWALQTGRADTATSTGSSTRTA